MALSTWWRGDVLPSLNPVPGFHAETSQDAQLITSVTGLNPAQVRERLAHGHLPYLAYIAEAPAGYGWVAQAKAEIGELDLRFTLPVRDRYLWDFATLPLWQGYGLYPRLLQSIISHQTLPVERNWILYAPENTPSGAGMQKAGFALVGQLSFRIDGSVGLRPYGPQERAQAGADLLGVPLIEQVLAPCWSCGSVTTVSRTDIDSIACWPPIRATETPCTCAVEKRPGRISISAGSK